MNTKQYEHIESQRLRDWHEPALSRSAVMKYTQSIDTKPIRDSHIGKCLTALIEQAFRDYINRPAGLCFIGPLSPIRLYTVRLRILSNV